MSHRALLILVCGALLALTGCISTAGPFVTDIQADADGNLIIEKCLVEHEFNGNYSRIETGPCRSFLLPLSKVNRAAPEPTPVKPETPPETP